VNERSTLAWLSDARRFALDAHDIAREMSVREFERGRAERLAVQFCLVIVGEALNEVPKDVQGLAPEIPWRAIYNLRNRLIHSFWLIDPEIVLDIAQAKTMPLIDSIDRLVAKLQS
jgi:uncharacterized protein with HEPN domain